MNHERYERLKNVFHAAVESAPEGRSEFIRAQCAGDADLEAEVLLLLGQLDERFLESPPRTPPPDSSANGPVAGQGPPQPDALRFASYTVLRTLGRGGMGVVYLAEQDGTKRTVALKVIRAGLATPGALQRFAFEAQVLGRLNHPGIAQVYEAGTADSGHGPQPYFAMELVDGVPITEHAREKRLSVAQRLAILAQICDAVEYAHVKGVIHRDLKPANILMDRSGQVKVLDFGVARAATPALDSSLTGLPSLNTEPGQMVGTLPYMSPEQIAGDPDDLDTRSDVYALGVIGYELLAGRPPYSVDKLPPLEAARIIQQSDPAPLSGVSKSCRGDIETVIAKSMEKERERRYQSAGALAADIRRHLNDEPIEARPASAWYQARKFARRNSALVAGISASFVLMIAGVAATSISRSQAVAARDKEYAAKEEATRQRNAALAARESEAEQRLQADTQRDRALAAEEEATKRAEELQRVSDFQARMLEQVDPTQAGILLTRDVNRQFDDALVKERVPEADRATQVAAFTGFWRRVNATDAARDLIDRTILSPAADAIKNQFEDHPAVKAALAQALADRYCDMGLFDRSLPLQEQALATRRSVLGELHPDTLRSINSTGELLEARGELDAAGQLYREALTKRRTALGEEHPDTLGSVSSLGSLLMAQGKLDEAEPYLREALEKRRRVLGEAHPGTLASIGNLGVLLRAQGKAREAEPYYRESLERTRRSLGEDHPETITALNNMGVLLQALGQLAAAEPYFREGLERSRRVLGEDHPDTLAAINNLGIFLRMQERLEDAEPYLREAMEKCRVVLGEEHPGTCVAVNNFGALLEARGQLNAAESYYREGLAMSRRVLGDEHPDTLASIINVGEVLQAQGKSAEAVELVTPAIPAARRAPAGANGRRLASLLMTLGSAQNRLGKFADAESNLLDAAAILSNTEGISRKEVIACTRAIVDLYTAWHNAESDKGFDAKAIEWRAKLDALSAPAQPTPSEAK